MDSRFSAQAKTFVFWLSKALLSKGDIFLLSLLQSVWSLVEKKKKTMAVSYNNHSLCGLPPDPLFDPPTPS